MTFKETIQISSINPIEWFYRAIGFNTDQDINESISGINPNYWEDILSYANHHGLAPYLYYKLSRGDLPDLIPEIVRNQLDRAHKLVSAKNARLASSFVQLSNEMLSSGIEFLVMKGMFLAEHVYPSAGLRPMVDIDILVHRSDAISIGRIFRKLGFQPGSSNEDELAIPFSNQIHFIHSQSGIEIEPHFHLFPVHLSNFDVDELWENSIEEKICGLKLRTFTIEEHLIHLSHHFAVKHLFSQAKHFLDIALIVKKYSGEIDCDYLLEIAGKQGCMNSLLVSLNLVRTVFGVEVSGFSSAELSTRRVSLSTEWALKCLMESSAHDFREYDQMFSALNMMRRGRFGRYQRIRETRIEASVVERGLSRNALIRFMDRIAGLIARYFRMLLKLAFNQEMRRFYLTKQWLMKD